MGRVINTLNTLAKAPIAGSCPTSVTRAAQLALTKVLAEEGGPHNVLVNALLGPRSWDGRTFESSQMTGIPSRRRM